MSDAVPDLERGARRRVPISATTLLIAANAAVFLAMWAGGVDPTDPDPEGLVRFGAIERTLVREGQWWRLLTAMFVHVGLLHIAVNMFSLWQVGPLVERLFGRGAFVALYVLSGLFASATSVVAHPAGVSAGASGAIFGIVGGLGAFMVRVGRQVFDRRRVRGLLQQLVLVVGLNLAIGFRLAMIDNAAHIGGLVSGIVLGAALAGSPTPESLAHTGRRTVVVTIVALAVLGAGALVLFR